MPSPSFHGPKQGGDAAQSTQAGPPTRFADVYVFALLAHTDKATLGPLDVNQWEFFVLPTAVLNERCPKQKRISFGVSVEARADDGELRRAGAGHPP